ncbi:transposase [Cohnella lubricantis]|uniref:IS1595 family transposase n=1 Tax=Cohnella lubricantis TaxID=2163172 RepID=A0A841TAS3_9BACL|nr:transposase [Cohnella lubricantis]MBB6677176.1 IS1595 family transposase [Cohnella lubricantis]MBP2117013.1 transposase-like protein [Cohnella lubricantis]
MNHLFADSFDARFDSEAACIEWLFQIRWPNGFECPSCAHSHATVISTRRLPLYECRRCLRQTSLTAGTILEKSRTPLRKWLYAMWLMSQPEQGINAVRLQSLLSVTYKTAFYMLRKLRLAMGSLEAQPALSGSVQAGLDYLGRGILSVQEAAEGRKTPIMTAVAMDTTGCLNQVALAVVPPAFVRDRCLLPVGKIHFAERYIDPNATSAVIADSLLRTNRQFVNLRIYGHSFRDWMLQTFHGLGGGYLQTYLDEFVFQVNASLQGVPPFEKLSYLSMRPAHPYVRSPRSVRPSLAA